MTAVQVNSFEMEASRNIVDTGSTAIAFLQQRLAVLHDQHRGAGDVAALQLQRNDPLEERLQVGLVQRMRGRRRGRGGQCRHGAEQHARAKWD
jgi:hypothetical protein